MKEACSARKSGLVAFSMSVAHSTHMQQQPLCAEVSMYVWNPQSQVARERDRKPVPGDCKDGLAAPSPQLTLPKTSPSRLLLLGKFYMAIIQVSLSRYVDKKECLSEKTGILTTSIPKLPDSNDKKAREYL